MAANASLSRAKAVQNDEFYTQYSDIEAEINAYIEFNPDVFRDKVILLPCDDPEWSNFTKYFAANFNRFGLKKLISMYEVLDGQQRITSFARYVNQSWQFAVEIDGKPRYFDSLDKDLQDRITNAPLTILEGKCL